MYYISNIKHLGKSRCIVYCNMYINFLRMGCVYKNQEIINSLCPKTVNDVNTIHVPYNFTI